MKNTLRTRIESDETAGRVVLEGTLDSSTYPTADAAFKHALRSGARMLALDVTALDFISSCGLGVIIGAYEVVTARGGTIILVNPRTQVVETLRTLGILGIFVMAASMAEATRIMETRRIGA
jgi:anti-anti-sigma factor